VSCRLWFVTWPAAPDILRQRGLAQYPQHSISPAGRRRFDFYTTSHPGDTREPLRSATPGPRLWRSIRADSGGSVLPAATNQFGGLRFC